MSARLVEGAGSAPFAPDETLGNLVDDVLTVLQGHGVVTDQMCSTSGNITAADTTIPLDDGDAVSRGVIEVGEELIFVTGSQNGQATAPAWGRGFKGTKAKAWPKGTRVTVAPVYPRSIVRRAVRQAIYALSPFLFAVKSVTYRASNISEWYALPPDAERVLFADWTPSGAVGPVPVRHWEMRHGTPECMDGEKLVRLPVCGGALVVQYAAAPAPPTTDGGLLKDMGLPASTRDVIVLGAALNLLPWLDAARLPTDTVPSDAEDQAKPVGSATAVARDLRSQYTAALQRERAALLGRFPVPIHGIR